MNPRDFKRTIAGFLLLASIVTAGSLYFALRPQSQEPGVSENTGLKQQNAFTEQVPENQDAATSNETVDAFKPTVSNPSNLTEVFAANYTKALVQANPDGLAPGGDGQGMDISLPDQGVDQILVQSTPKAQYFPTTPTSSLRIETKYSKSDIQKYQNFVTTLLQSLSSNQALALAQQEKTPESMGALSLAFSNAYDETLITPVPQPLTNLHKSLLDYLSAEKIALESGYDYQNDPLKAALAIQDPTPQNRSVALLSNLLQAQKTAFAPNKTSDFAFLVSYFSIPDAHAQGLFVPTWEMNPALTITATQQTIETVKTVKQSILDQILSYLVSKLINMIQNMTLSWIAGNGKPKFITNWQTFLGDAGIQAAQIAFNNYGYNLCGNIRLQLKAPLLPVNYATQMPQGCTLNQLKNNILGFYGDFRNGGWATYGQVLQPNNNYYGSFILMQDYQLEQQNKAQTAAQNEGLASNGFKPIRRCVNWHTTNNLDKAAAGTGSVTGNLATDLGCKTATTWENGLPVSKMDCSGTQGSVTSKANLSFSPETDTCDDYQNVTPGQAVGMSLNNAIGLKNSRIVNAKQLNDLVGAVIDGALNRIIGMGLSGLSNLAKSSGNSSNDSTNYLSEDQAYAQYGKTGQDQINTQINQGQDQLDQFQTAQDTLNQARNNDEQWLSLSSTTIQDLTNMISACAASSTLVGSASSHIVAVQTASSTVNQELSRIQELTLSFENGTMLPGDTTETQMILASSSARLTDLQTLDLHAEMNTSSTALCSVPL